MYTHRVTGESFGLSLILVCHNLLFVLFGGAVPWVAFGVSQRPLIGEDLNKGIGGWGERVRV